MIKALHRGLAIPARVLLQGQEESVTDGSDIQWNRFPVRDMVARGWIEKAAGTDLAAGAETLVRHFLAGLGPAKIALAFYRHTRSIRSARSMDTHALIAWTARIGIRARQTPPRTNFEHGSVTLQFMRELAKLSAFESGPTLAIEYLSQHGISLVVEPQLPRTHLDGCAILLDLDKPVIGMTLRHDRIDNFWFCLMHELAHISLHLGEGSDQFLDDLDSIQEQDPREKQADQLAGEALVPESEWKKSPASRIRSPEAMQLLARQLGIHPGVVAGRIRHHFKSYHVLNQFVGHGQVRKLFPEIDWETGRVNVRP